MTSRTMQILITLLLAVLFAGCSSTPTTPQNDGPYCTLWVERTVTYNGQTFKQRECAVWLFGPSRDQDVRFRYRFPSADRRRP
jgi:hypothetical protein